MTADTPIFLLLGHLTGDFLLQTKSMALNKSKSGFSGTKVCIAHVLIYTITLCALLQIYNPIVFLAIFVPHFVIDRWSLGGKWLKLIRGRTFESAYTATEYREFDIAFTAIVYTVVDATLHMITLLPVLYYLL